MLPSMRSMPPTPLHHAVPTLARSRSTGFEVQVCLARWSASQSMLAYSACFLSDTCCSMSIRAGAGAHQHRSALPGLRSARCHAHRSSPHPQQQHSRQLRYKIELISAHALQCLGWPALYAEGHHMLTSSASTVLDSSVCSCC